MFETLLHNVEAILTSYAHELLGPGAQDHDTNSKTNTGTNTGSNTGSNTGTDTDTTTGSNTGTDTDTTTGSNTGTDTDTTTGTDPPPLDSRVPTRTRPSNISITSCEDLVDNMEHLTQNAHVDIWRSDDDVVVSVALPGAHARNTFAVLVPPVTSHGPSAAWVQEVQHAQKKGQNKGPKKLAPDATMLLLVACTPDDDAAAAFSQPRRVVRERPCTLYRKIRLPALDAASVTAELAHGVLRLRASSALSAPAAITAASPHSIRTPRYACVYPLLAIRTRTPDAPQPPEPQLPQLPTSPHDPPLPTAPASPHDPAPALHDAHAGEDDGFCIVNN